MKLLTLILSLSLTSKAFSDCSPVTPIQSGQIAPCTGFIFTPEKELELRIKNENYKSLLEQSKIHIQQKELNKKLLEDSEQIAYKEREKSEVWKKQAELLAEKNTKSEDIRNIRDWVFFGLGIGVSILTGKFIRDINKD